MADDELILVRAAPGQAAVFEDVLLAVGTLRLVNGYTRLGDLVARLDAGHDWHAAACDLIDRGLMTESVSSLSTAWSSPGLPP